MATTNSTILAGYVKRVVRNRDTRDYDAIVVHPDGEEMFLGSRDRS